MSRLVRPTSAFIQWILLLSARGDVCHSRLCIRTGLNGSNFQAHDCVVRVCAFGRIKTDAALDGSKKCLPCNLRLGDMPQRTTCGKTRAAAPAQAYTKDQPTRLQLRRTVQIVREIANVILRCYDDNQSDEIPNTSCCKQRDEHMVSCCTCSVLFGMTHICTSSCSRLSAVHVFTCAGGTATSTHNHRKP